MEVGAAVAELEVVGRLVVEEKEGVVQLGVDAGVDASPVWSTEEEVIV